tara:strand:- start:2173 stop:3372 length:1200 start_codon:yes stop_codon:yes gene_type:complete
MPSPTARLERIRLLKFGKHASATDVTTDAATSYFLDARNGFQITTDQQRVERPLIQSDNYNYLSVNGVKESGLAYDLELRGINGGAGNGTSSAYATKTQLGSILDVVCGTNGSDGTGDNLGTQTATNLVTAGGAGTMVAPVGNALLARGATSGVYQAREVITSADPDFTVARPFLQADSTPEQAEDGSECFASASWYLNAANANHIHGWHEVEGDSFTRKFFGGMTSMGFTFEAGGLCMANMDWSCTNWTDAGNGGTLTYAAQPAGFPVVGKEILFCIGSTRYDLISATIDLGLESTPKTALDAPNALSGYKCIKFDPKITCQFYYNEALHAALQAANTSQDISLQAGVTAGSAALFRMPNADPREVKHSTTDGIETIDVTFHATIPSAGDGSLRIHLF